MRKTLTFMDSAAVGGEQELVRNKKAEKATWTLVPSRGRLLNLAHRSSTVCDLLGGQLPTDHDMPTQTPASTAPLVSTGVSQTLYPRELCTLYKALYIVQRLRVYRPIFEEVGC